tara:strand:+ start:679 stop:840 length:162 start_codon:yes stop_codon:yes gene_type:complete
MLKNKNNKKRIENLKFRSLFNFFKKNFNDICFDVLLNDLRNNKIDIDEKNKLE